MVIGDFYTEGCCPDNYTKSFPDLLNRNPRYCVMNFGVSFTDPVQYNLVVGRYLKEIHPDKVVINVYGGNDLPDYRRIPSPGTPIAFPFKGNRWLFSVTDNVLSLKLNYTLKTDQEAYSFFVEHYTLKGNDRNIFEKLISYSVCFSKIYLDIQYKIREKKWKEIYANIPHKPERAQEIANMIFKEIQVKCNDAQIPVYFCLIPSPVDVKKVTDIRSKYAPFFAGLTWYLPDDITTSDYDGMTTGNHFNNSGHKKYYTFLEKVIASGRKNQDISKQ